MQGELTCGLIIAYALGPQSYTISSESLRSVCFFSNDNQPAKVNFGMRKKYVYCSIKEKVAYSFHGTSMGPSIMGQIHSVNY